MKIRNTHLEKVLPFVKHVPFSVQFAETTAVSVGKTVSKVQWDINLWHKCKEVVVAFLKHSKFVKWSLVNLKYYF